MMWYCIITHTTALNSSGQMALHIVVENLTSTQHCKARWDFMSYCDFKAYWKFCQANRVQFIQKLVIPKPSWAVWTMNNGDSQIKETWTDYGFFLLSATFQTYCPNLPSLAGCRTWCPTDLQHLCCKALINNQVY